MDWGKERMRQPTVKSSFLDKILGRIDRLNPEGLQTVVERLAREHTFLDMLFRTIEDGVLVVDSSGGIVFFNDAVTHLLGIPEDTDVGMPVSRYLPGLDWKQLASLDNAEGKRVVRHELEVKYPKPRFLRLYAAPLETGVTNKSGVALILHDATEAREQTAAAIETERIQALTLLAASVAHEIGNPLNALNIHLQLMEREMKKLRLLATAPSSPAARPARLRREAVTADWLDSANKIDRYLGVAKGEISRLDYIITQFLQAIRPSKPKIEPAALNEVLASAVELLRPELENRGQTVTEKYARQLPMVPLDPAQIKQVLVNLIKNAMQAMTKGGELTLQTGQTSEAVWFSVVDTGGGIPEETLNHLFEPYYTTKQKGSGLGLMIVQRIVRDHGGRIEMDSRAGQGTTFRVWLPLHEPQPRLLEEHAPSSPDKPLDVE